MSGGAGPLHSNQPTYCILHILMFDISNVKYEMQQKTI